MEYANLININGEKRVIHANEYKPYIHRGHLKCPRCGEVVTFIDARKMVKHFKHYHGTRREDCENYCKSMYDGISQTPYEHKGLPLYLIKQMDAWSLNVGLYGISEAAIYQAARNNLTVKVLSDDTLVGERRVDAIGFAPNEMHHIKINDCSKVYRLMFESSMVPDEIEEKWGRDVNGIGDNGAIFEYSPNGGKKVTSASGLQTKRDYYLLTDRILDKHRYKSVEATPMGSIRFSNADRFAIYKFTIQAIQKDSIEFCSKYGMTLTHKPPELIPLWPPCRVNDQELVYPSQDSRFFMLTGMQHEEKTLYSEKFGNALGSEGIDGDRRLVKSTVRLDDFLILGTKSQPFVYSVITKSVDPFKHDFCYSTRSTDIHALEVLTNVKLKGIHWKNGLPCGVFIINKENAQIQKPRRNECIEILHGLDIVIRFAGEEKKPEPVDNGLMDDLLYDLIKYRRNDEISLPSSFKCMLQDFRYWPKTYRILREISKRGSISNDVYRLLKINYLSMRRSNG